ncbi:MAG: tyrosine--tRNA ligase [Acidimicrobiales bacterium]|nr:tyrosine--tRNA ligase [Acidimicrobiales bacterium]
MPDLLDDLDRRGLIHDSTDRASLGARMAEGPITLYYGCDPTAPSLHIGNLIGLLLLGRFQDAGHRPIALAGGATGMVGDPSGRSEERNLLDDAALTANVAVIKEQMGRIVDLDAPGAALVDNRDWTGRLTLLEFLRDVGKHVTVNQMLARESVKARLESEHGISFTEFSYMLLQANDYLWLHDHHACDLQIGGSDQWGNILAGIDLVRRVRSDTVHGLCWPLLTAADGTKLGKTTGARVWLDARLTSPYAFFQHWMRTDDADLRRFLAQFTRLPMEEVEAAVAAHEEAPQRRLGQRALAEHVTTLVHGVAEANAAGEAAGVLFGGDPRQASAAALAVVAQEVPGTSLEAGEALSGGVELAPVLVRAGLAASLSDARRQLQHQGIAVNGAKAAPDRQLGPDDLLHGRWVLLRKGKRDWAVVDAGRSRAAHDSVGPPS